MSRLLVVGFRPAPGLQRRTWKRLYSQDAVVSGDATRDAKAEVLAHFPDAVDVRVSDRTAERARKDRVSATWAKALERSAAWKREQAEGGAK